jgi:hypothetical protein
MSEAAAAVPGQGLMSFGGMEVAALQACLQAQGAHAAIVTGTDTLIAGGPDAALQKAAAELAGQGVRSTALPVGLASHTPLMQAAAPFLAALEAIDVHAPAMPLLAGVTGQAIADPTQARQLLARQLTETIQWSACMDACAERGVTVALELGPGNALAHAAGAAWPHPVPVAGRFPHAGGLAGVVAPPGRLMLSFLPALWQALRAGAMVKREAHARLLSDRPTAHAAFCSPCRLHGEPMPARQVASQDAPATALRQ